MEVFRPYLGLLLPGTCFDEFLVHYNFFDVVCWKLFISKCLGYGIIAGSVLVKLPQILKIAAAGSGAGLSMLSLYLEIVAIVSTCSYGMQQGFPFSAYGDSIFMLIQSTIVITMVLFFNGQHMTNAAYLIIQSIACYVLFTGMVPSDVIWALQASVMPIIVVSKMIQAYENFRSGSTGQLSAITVALLFFGALARVFTSIQETGDTTVIAIFVVATICNGILLSQVILYWNSDEQEKKDKKKKKA